jgi:hypothetical protein
MLLSGCTFGTLTMSECIGYYGPGAVETISVARSHGLIVEEAYSYCLDGRRRADALAAAFQAHGFQSSAPARHIEVPGAWCMVGTRSVQSASADLVSSLQTACAIGDRSRAYMTGGTLRTDDGKEHRILSTYNREGRERLESSAKETPRT